MHLIETSIWVNILILLLLRILMVLKVWHSLVNQTIGSFMQLKLNFDQNNQIWSKQSNLINDYNILKVFVWFDSLKLVIFVTIIF
jgi:hypothetical protein